MKLTRIIPAASGAILGSLLSFNVTAHALWLEGDNAEARLYFGEYAENKRETSPGRLDSIVEPVVTVVDTKGKEKRVEASRVNNHFAIPLINDPAGATVLVHALKQAIREPQ